MVIESIEIEIDLKNTVAQLDCQAIEAYLQNWGEPLRWAITAVVSTGSVAAQRTTNVARIEAIVIKKSTKP